MFHYIYRITNITLNKHYYGVRSSKVEPKLDLGIKYFSSSSDKEFIKDQKENKFNYKYKVIKIFETKKEAISMEIKLHSKFNVGINESFYNKAKQTSMGFDTTGISLTKDTIKKIIKTKKENGTTKLLKKTEIIEKFKYKRGNRYNYSIIEYKGLQTPVNIICKIHGSFYQRPDNHLSGANCPTCVKIKKSRNINVKYSWKEVLTKKALNKIEKNKKRINKFIYKSNIIHKNKYNYEKIKFVDYHTKIIITCPIHGDYLQSPKHHINGHGCQVCGKTHYRFSLNV